MIFYKLSGFEKSIEIAEIIIIMNNFGVILVGGFCDKKTIFPYENN